MELEGEKEMNDWLNKPWVIRVISLFLAILTFLVISFDNQDQRSADVGSFDSIFNNSRETATLEDVPVNIVIDDELYVVSGVPEVVTMSLTGTVSVVQSTVTQRNFDVYVDLEGLSPGTHTVPIEHDGISSRIDVQFEPENVEVTIEERASGTYEVMVDYSNLDQMPEGFEIESAVVTPTTVEITSAQSVIDRISSVKAFVDVEGINESMTLNDVPVRIYDNEGNQMNARIEPGTVTVELTVINPKVTVPIELNTTGELPEGVRLVETRIALEEVDVYASSNTLADIDMVETEPIDFSTVSETTTLDVALVIPDGGTRLSVETVEVTLEVETETETTLEDVDITVDNVTEGLSATILDPESGTISILLSGYPSDLDRINPERLDLTVNADNLIEGEYNRPLEYNQLDNIRVTLPLEDVTIRIN